MLKETIRQLASSTEKLSMAMGGQLQVAGISAAEKKALLDSLSNKNDKNIAYAMWG
ncbi:competence pheromone ComX [Paenibacillus sp. N4]|uniref:competence pheromone ComX n=1 Tax=Paenibacillus vietnamensis TaxID=2590547 RepID=UPI001CD13617|nr:competence pheromone ComX [Paenibacillus vietnamensis]MCA0756694.1 competence pheromone ComX [Paenibacillus vietnamensis]